MSVLARDVSAVRSDRYLVDRMLDRWELTPVRITLVYLVFGFSALYFSDVLLARQFSGAFLEQLQSMKGAVEVLLTAGLLYGLTTTKRAQVDRSDRKLDRQREELLVLHRVLRHNLRNDLNVIMGMGERLARADAHGAESRPGAVVLKTARKMMHYTEQAARIRQVTARNGHFVEKDLATEVPKIVENHPLVSDGVDVELDLPRSAAIRTNHMFPEAIEELIGNSIEHNDRDSPRLEVTVDPTAGPLHHVEISVADNGPGIPERVVSILEQSESDQLTHLQGMGLWFVYWVVAESDGHLVIDGREDGGAIVRVRVPSSAVVTSERLSEALEVG